jgi:serpin B
MTRKTPLLFLCILIVGFVSCNKNNVNPDKGKDLVLSPAEQQKVAADNAFTLKLFKQISATATGNDNLFVSPLSVSFAMGMTINGAKGETLQSINNTMNFNGFSQDTINSYYKKLITELPQLDPNTKLNIANSIWYKQGFDVLQPFITTNTNAYNAKVQALDFANPTSKDVINNWVKDATNGKIPSIIHKISGNDLMYLINAIYFKSTWKNKFDADKTSKQAFTTGDNSQVQTDFMTGRIDYNIYHADANLNPTVIAEFPYGNDKYSMVVVLPTPGVSPKALLGDIDTAKWQTWMTGLKPTTNTVYFPKFSFSYQKSLNNDLTSLGMGNAFSEMADFTGINANGQLRISSVMHKAFVEVNEQGTEAAAATSVGISSTSAPANELRLNRPFIFAIREMKTGLILFTGIVNNPLLTEN